MKQISSLELHFLLNEFEVLKNSRVDNIYNSGKEEFIFQFYKSNAGKIILKVIVGKAFFISEEKTSDSSPSSFCALLRKHLNGKFLTSIRQLEPERIIEFVFESKDEKRIIFMEFFGEGNIILCDSDFSIMNALILHKFKGRSILPKFKYEYPKMGINIFEINENDIKNLFKNSKKDKIVTSLAIEFGLGGVYAEEVCLLSKTDKNISPQNISSENAKSILNSIKNLLNKKTNPKIYFDTSQIADAVPFELEFYSKFEEKDFDKFGNALGFYYSHAIPKKKSEHEKKLAGLKRILDEQTAAVEQLKNEEIELREKGELIFHKYSLIKEIIDELNKASKTHSWKEIREKLKEHKIIKEINEKERYVVIDI